ncbi:HSP20 family molecular chaperone IbpA [Arthrobacter sp. V4I6]|nr:HSP20 family molecular chaperone IbpA [Arthrobacter sp. V1I7]MDQ0853405.1 HSP20 family molecular chaperone IbpA [Arthrobacter sp. V4I6]
MYDGGVLTLRIPVTEKAKPRKIEIETKEAQHQIGA